jgi:uncharacterized protein (TIGR02391 family)
VLSINVHRQLLTLISQVNQLISSVESCAATSEVELRAAAARETLDSLATMISSGPTGSFNHLARHLHWLLRYYREGKPDRYAPDIADLQERDLPGVIDAVEKWAQGLLDPRLVEAISASWEAQQYGSAVRDAFIHLEDVLRDLGNVDPAEGLSGEKLVTRVLGPNRDTRITLPSNGLLGQLTRGETTGAYHLIRGAFLLVRNATAHRPIAYSQEEAEDIIHLINLCLRILSPHSSEQAQIRAT